MHKLTYKGQNLVKVSTASIAICTLAGFAWYWTEAVDGLRCLYDNIVFTKDRYNSQRTFPTGHIMSVDTDIVVITARDIRQGEVLQMEDLTTREVRETKGFHPKSLWIAELAIGKRVDRNIKKGSTVLATDLKPFCSSYVRPKPTEEFSVP